MPGSARSRVPRLVVEDLDATDLLALLLGGPAQGAADGARSLLTRRDLVELSRAHPAELVREHGLRPTAATRLAAAFALGRRTARAVRPPRTPLRSAARVHHLLGPELQGLERETFHVLLLDGKHALLRRERISTGTLTASLVHPREVYRSAVREGAAAILCAHNHPSGDPEPSGEDLEVTRRLRRAGRLLGIPLLDHVVIGEGRFVSLRERMGFQ